MARKVDPEVLEGFVEEAQGYLPRIWVLLADYGADPSRAEDLAEAHRLLHSIKGASSMVGLSALSHMAFFAEEVLEELSEETLTWSRSAEETLKVGISLIGQYLNDLESGEGDDGREKLHQVIEAFHRFRGKPRSAVDTLVDRLIGAKKTEEKSFATEEQKRLWDQDRQHPVEHSVPADLLEVFLEEAGEHHQAMSAGLRRFEEKKSARVLKDIWRTVHTLKGAAYTVGIESVGRLSHRLEDLLGEVIEERQELDEEGLRLVFETGDTIEDMLESYADRRPFRGDLEQLYANYSRILDGEPGAGVDESPTLETGPPDAEVSASETAEDPVVSEVAEPPATEEEHPSAAVEEAAQQSSREPSSAMAGIPSFVMSPPEGSSNQSESWDELETSRVEDEEASEDAKGEATLRVSLERLDEMVALVSELVVHRSAFERYFGRLSRQIEELQFSTGRLRRLVTRFENEYEVQALLTGQPVTADAEPVMAEAAVGVETQALAVGGGDGKRPRFAHEFDELEFDRYSELHLFSRELAEVTSDVGAVGGELRYTQSDFDGYLNRLNRLTSEVQDKLMQLRMVSFARLTTRLHRAVRLTADSQGKQARLVIEGERVELDRTVLEELADPLIHLLRNAVDHGIEPPALRQVLGKPETGRIRIRAYREGNQIVIEVRDDGTGIDPQMLRTEALDQGLLSETDLLKISDEDLTALIFHTGFSTASQISEVSGRGLGLDIVYQTVRRLKGTVAVESRQSEGTLFKIRLPLTLSVDRVLLLGSSQERFALPLGVVRQIVQLETDQVEKVGQEPMVKLQDELLPVHFLEQLLRLPHEPRPWEKYRPALVLEVGGRRLVLVVEDLLGAKEVVIKPLGPLLSQLHGFAGATFLGDGKVVLILDPADLFGEGEGREVALAPGSSLAASIPALAEESRSAPIEPKAKGVKRGLDILIVDDSLSVRRVLTNVVQKAGWQAEAAKDGVEALETLQQRPVPPDIILLDIEMPRMDGYELTATLRGDERFQGVPIIIITSRAGEKHRRKAFELGATEYLVKPYQEDVLLSLIRKITREGT